MDKKFQSVNKKIKQNFLSKKFRARLESPFLIKKVCFVCVNEECNIPDVLTGAMRGWRTFLAVRRKMKGGGFIRGWIVGTTEPLFRGKEREIFEIKRLCDATRRSKPATKLAYEVHLRVRNVCPRECASWKFRRFEPFERDLQQFSAAQAEGDRDIPSLLRREYSTRPSIKETRISEFDHTI